MGGGGLIKVEAGESVTQGEGAQDPEGERLEFDEPQHDRY